MKCCTFGSAIAFTAAGLAAVVGSIAFTQPGKDKAPAGQPEAQLPPGITPDMMQACSEAATPGAMHARMAECVGTWAGPTKMWMTAEQKEPMTSETKATFSMMMDGRFLKMELAGADMGMGAFSGFGLYGYDNVSKKFQSTWVDNMGTGMMMGHGELTTDGSTLNWSYKFHCPIQKKEVSMREVERRIDANTTVIEMYGPDPKTGKEFKMMECTMKRTGAARTGEAKPAATKPAHAPTTPAK